jgi:anaerobic ribonucleoside-triphosphate reductase activating protein
MDLRVNYTMPMSLANGPGRRYTLWVQGCSIHCRGCSNTDTWDPEKGYNLPIDDIIRDIQNSFWMSEKNTALNGITVTGGEPLDQFEAVFELCKRISEWGYDFDGKTLPFLSVFLTTGYTLSQIVDKGLWKILGVLDIICVGPFEEALVCSGQWKGSSNQELYYLTEEGKSQRSMPVVKKEYHIGQSGNILKTGFSQ